MLTFRIAMSSVPETLARWIRAPRQAHALQAARRLGLVQVADEALALARLIAALRPRRLLEIGTARGGSLLLWARAAAADATLVSVDRPPWPLDGPAEAQTRRALRRVGSRRQVVHAIRGDSHNLVVRARAAAAFDGQPIDVLIIDGDHAYDGVAADFHDYAGWVRPGGLIALHDIYPHSQGWGGEVPRFWREIRDRHVTTELIANPDQDGFGIGVITAPADRGALR